jgi:hypothetical protein
MASIYHGTTEALAIEALATGIKPREDRDELTVHVTYGFAPLMASMAGENDEKWAIIDILESSIGIATPPNMPLEIYLDEQLLLTGERPLDIGPEDLLDWSEEERMAYFKEHIADYGSMWNASYTDIGSLGWMDTIVPASIQGVVVFDPTLNPVIAKAAQAQVQTTKSYAQLDTTQRLLTSWFFGAPLTPEEFVGPLAEPQLTTLSKSQLGDMTAALRDYSALTTIFPVP